MLLPFHLLVVVLANLHRGVCQSVSPNGTDPGFFTYPINPSMTVMSGQVLNIIWSTDFTAFDLYYELVTEQRPDDIPIQQNISRKTLNYRWTVPAVSTQATYRLRAVNATVPFTSNSSQPLSFTSSDFLILPLPPTASSTLYSPGQSATARATPAPVPVTTATASPSFPIVGAIGIPVAIAAVFVFLVCVIRARRSARAATLPVARPRGASYPYTRAELATARGGAGVEMGNREASGEGVMVPPPPIYEKTWRDPRGDLPGYER